MAICYLSSALPLPLLPFFFPAPNSCTTQPLCNKARYYKKHTTNVAQFAFRGIAMKLGFIGCGNMAKAIIQGIASKGLVAPENIMGSNSNANHAAQTHELLGIQTTTSNTEVVAHADIVFLCVKPQQYAAVLAEIKASLAENQILVSIAPGKTLAWLEEQLGHPAKLVRVMPNTPALVGEGTTTYCLGSLISPEEAATIAKLLESFGMAIELKEHLMDAASAVGGSAPAYVYLFIEALADGGVAEGLPREQALTIAAQTVLGSAKMVLESGKHPGQLKDEVCSPGGSTIEGVRELEAGAFRGTTMAAIQACAAKAKRL
jgi:pyrroline-5-carboxylate reductase